MEITEKLIRDGASNRGGWNRAQLNLIGAEWPPKNGWIAKAVGQPISEDQASEFLRLRGETVRVSRKKRSMVKTDLPIPPDFPVKDETVIASFWLYVSRMERERLKQSIPVLEYIARKAKQKTA
jgi:hypothetical protein